MTVHDAIPAHLEEKIELSQGLAIFRFALSRDFVFKPGQYATMWLTHHGKTIPRPYSIASSPMDTRTMEFYINLVADGNLTPSLWDPEVIHGLQAQCPETSVAITGPKGLFVLDGNDRRNLILVASGTGLAPFISMIRMLNADYLRDPEGCEPRTVWVAHGVSHPANLGYHDELQSLASETLKNPGRRLGIVYFPTISRPYLDPSWRGLKGRVETLFEDSISRDSGPIGLEEIVKGMLLTVARPETHAVYICGHPGTVDNVVRSFTARGFKVGVDLKNERYYP
jgi:ferredoxin/flavodoxin---NADP+ reductase